MRGLEERFMQRVVVLFGKMCMKIFNNKKEVKGDGGLCEANKPDA